MGFPLQVCYEPYVIYAYILGNKVPPCFSFKNLGSSIDFIVPSYLNLRIRGLNVCSIFEHSNPQEYEPHTVISNRTKGLVWCHRPYVFGIAEDGADMMWLSYWKFGNHLEGGDEVNILVSGGKLKEVGVRLICKQEQEEMSSQSAFEDKKLGNIVPGNVSSQQPSTKLYQLGRHHGCKYCEHLYPPPWIPAPYDYDYTVESLVSRLTMAKPFYVSQDHGR